MLVFAWLVSYPTFAYETIVESFDGFGEYESIDGRISGLDNPGWMIDGRGGLNDGSYEFANDPNADIELVDFIWRDLSQSSFVQTIEIRNLDLDVGKIMPNEPVFGSSRIYMNYFLDHLSVPSVLSSRLAFRDEDDWVYVTSVNGETDVVHITPSKNVSLGVSFYEHTRRVLFSFDDDIDDLVPPLISEYTYEGQVGDIQRTVFEARALRFGSVRGNVDNWYLAPHPFVGDFDDDGILDVLDIDLLSNEVRNGTNKPAFDLGNDNMVDESDRVIWVHDLKNTYFGDANFDGEFNSSDFVAVFQAGEYEDDIEMNSGWAEGDWNGDGDFTSRDFVFAFQDGGYEKGPRVAAVVPEPSSVFLVLLGVAVLFARMRSN